MRSLLVLETLFGLAVLVAGGSYVLLRRAGRAAWPAVAGLALLVFSLLAGTAWTLHQWRVAERGVGAELVNLLQWDRLIGTTIEFTFVAGMLVLIVSIFTGRDPRPTESGS